jgi:hypothetical protein
VSASEGSETVAHVSSAGAWELRVHGVSGTPPEDLLDRPLVEQIAGDKIAGFYVPRLPDERVDAAPGIFAPRQPRPPRLAGYSWGGLTSGSAGRAFWLILLPFTFINIAPRARPPTHSATGAFTWLIWYLCRLLALTLTVMFVLAAVGVGEDLIAWQCAGTSDCVKSMPNWVIEQNLPIERMLLVGALVPLFFLLALWRVSARTANSYERTIADVAEYRELVPARKDPDTNLLEVGLDSRLMWRNADPVRRLRAVHLQCGFAVIIWSLVAPTDSRWLAVAPAAIVIYTVIVLGSRKFTGHGSSDAWRAASRVVWGVLIICVAWLVVGLARASITVDAKYVRSAPGVGRIGYRGLPLFDATVLVDAAVALGLIVALIVVVCLAAWTGTAPVAGGNHADLKPGLFGLACAAFASLGVFLAAAFTSGIYIYVAAFLRTGSLKPKFEDVSKLYHTVRVPITVATATLAYTFAVLGLLVLLVIWAVAVGIRWLRPGRDAQLNSDYPVRAGKASDVTARGNQIRRDMLWGALVDKLPWLVGPLVVTGLVIVAVFAIQLGLHVHTPIEDLFGTAVGWTSKNFLSGVGAYLVVSTLLGLVSLGAIAFRVPATRRVVGILWDVASFWPRASHPLAPPCYAERAVPDLVTFITHHRVSEPDGSVVIAAHSQGTVISAATMFQLAAFDEAPAVPGKAQLKVMHRLAFLSFGCVLRRLYGRYFPVYFGPDQLAKLQTLLHPAGQLDEQPRWRNLWRYTDYLGGQVTTGPPQISPTAPIALTPPGTPPAEPPFTGPNVDWEWHAPDPPRFDRDDGDTTYPAAHRHSDFWKDQSGYFQLAVKSLLDQIEKGAG